MIERPLYRAQLLARCHTVKNAGRERMNAFVSYDYMGAAEYEFGAIPGSMARLRIILNDNLKQTKGEHDGLHLFEHTSEELIAKTGPYAGKRLYSLMAETKARPEFIAAYESELIKLTARNVHMCKEPPYFNRSFYNTDSDHFDVWHDIKNDIFFAHNEAVLMLVRATLTRDIAIAEANGMRPMFKGGDKIKFVVPTPGVKDTPYEVSCENWIVANGTIHHLEDDAVHILMAGHRFALPWTYLLTVPPAAYANIDMEKLRVAASR